MGGMELVSMDLDGAVELKGTYLEKVEWNGIGQNVWDTGQLKGTGLERMEWNLIGQHELGYMSTEINIFGKDGMAGEQYGMVCEWFGTGLKRIEWDEQNSSNPQGSRIHEHLNEALFIGEKEKGGKEKGGKEKGGKDKIR